MDGKIIVAGIGPGAENFISPAARDAIVNAKILVGGRRALSQFAVEGQKIFPITAAVNQRDAIGVRSNRNARLIGGELHWTVK